MRYMLIHEIHNCTVEHFYCDQSVCVLMSELVLYTQVTTIGPLFRVLIIEGGVLLTTVLVSNGYPVFTI